MESHAIECSQSESLTHSDKNINTDNRNIGCWKTRYCDPKAKLQIWLEVCFVSILLAVSLSIIFFNWLGVFSSFISRQHDNATLTKYIYYIATGLLGGTTYNAKYLYRSVGRGFWSQDRVVWRLLSPPVSMIVAFIIGAMIECGFADPKVTSSGARCVVIGFLSGYFADKAVGFMCDIADLLFGKQISKTHA